MDVCAEEMHNSIRSEIVLLGDIQVNITFTTKMRIKSAPYLHQKSAIKH